jgi:hypothetical protein
MGSLTYNLTIMRIYKSSIKSIYPKTVSEGSILKKVRKAIFQGFTCPARHYTPAPELLCHKMPMGKTHGPSVLRYCT